MHSLAGCPRADANASHIVILPKIQELAGFRRFRQSVALVYRTSKEVGVCLQHVHITTAQACCCPQPGVPMLPNVIGLHCSASSIFSHSMLSPFCFLPTSTTIPMFPLHPFPVKVFSPSSFSLPSFRLFPSFRRLPSLPASTGIRRNSKPIGCWPEG